MNLQNLGAAFMYNDVINYDVIDELKGGSNASELLYSKAEFNKECHTCNIIFISSRCIAIGIDENTIIAEADIMSFIPEAEKNWSLQQEMFIRVAAMEYCLAKYIEAII